MKRLPATADNTAQPLREICFSHRLWYTLSAQRGQEEEFRMRKVTPWMLSFIVLFYFFLLQGCASNKPLVNKDFTSLAPLTVVCHYGDKGPIHIVSTGGTVISLLSPIAGIGTMVYEHSLEKKMKSALETSFEELVVGKFVDRASKEIPNWPVMTIKKAPIMNSYKEYRYYIYNLHKFIAGNTMLFTFISEFKTGLVSSNLEMKSKAIIRDSGGNLLWMKVFVYNSKKFGRKWSFKEYKADNFKLLKEEMEFAADTIVSNFIESLLK